MAIDQWTGAHAAALQHAHHMSIEQFARKLGLSVRGVAEWHRRPAMVPTKTTQQVLDEELARVSAEVRVRFDRHVSGMIGADEPSATAGSAPGNDRPQTAASAI